MRDKVVKTILPLAKKMILVVPIFDRLTAEYAGLCDGFDNLINIGANHKMVIRPAERKIMLDGIDDYFCFAKNVVGVWLLTKGVVHESQDFARQARGTAWRNENTSTTRFARYEDGIGPFNVTTLQ